MIKFCVIKYSHSAFSYPNNPNYSINSQSLISILINKKFKKQFSQKPQFHGWVFWKVHRFETSTFDSQRWTAWGGRGGRGGKEDKKITNALRSWLSTVSLLFFGGLFGIQLQFFSKLRDDFQVQIKFISVHWRVDHLRVNKNIRNC